MLVTKYLVDINFQLAEGFSILILEEQKYQALKIKQYIIIRDVLMALCYNLYIASLIKGF